MTLSEYKTEIDRRIAVQRDRLDEDIEACKHGVWCGDRINMTAWTLSIYQGIRSDLDRMQL